MTGLRKVKSASLIWPVSSGRISILARNFSISANGCLSAPEPCTMILLTSMPRNGLKLMRGLPAIETCLPVNSMAF